MFVFLVLQGKNIFDMHETWPNIDNMLKFSNKSRVVNK